MRDELKFAAKHPWWVVGVVVVTFVAGSLALATVGWWAFTVLAVVEWVVLVTAFTYYFNLYARADSAVDVDVDVEARAREEEL